MNTTSPSNGNNGRNGNGWITWVLGIVSSLILASIIASVAFNYNVAGTLGRHDVLLDALNRRIDERTLSRFTREDFEREMRSRDESRIRNERRIDELERRNQLRAQ